MLFFYIFVLNLGFSIERDVISRNIVCSKFCITAKLSKIDYQNKV